jgi:RNA polymerase sigma-70 factor (ECF subfamily)
LANFINIEISRCVCGRADHDHSPLHEEAMLVQSLLAGERRAWKEFMRRYEPGVRRCITSVVSRFRRLVSVEDEEEIFAEFCVRLLQNDRSKLGAFDPDRGCSLSSWLGMVAIQTARDHLRRRRRDSYRDHMAELDAIQSSGPDPFDQCLQDERIRLARGLVENLSDRDREFIGRMCSEAFDAEQVAQQMGISVATVYTKKHKLVSRLTRMVGQDVHAA